MAVLPPAPGALLLEVLDNDTRAPKFWIGVVADTVFNTVDDSSSTENGWTKVRMSERTWQAFYARYVNKNRLGLGGEPRALKPDGTLA